MTYRTTSLAAIALLLALGACEAEPARNYALIAPPDAVSSAAPAPPPEQSAPAPSPVKEVAETAPALSLCWQDYCPCDGPETALDHTICRNAQGGVAMSDDQWAIGAMARDMKRESDDLSRQSDEGIAEINAHRIYDRGY